MSQIIVARYRGFTLIETAIVLFIVGLVMSGIVALVSAVVANRQIEATKTKQEAIKTALISFIARNNRMPCPALPNLAEGESNNGVEANPDLVNRLCTGLTPVGAGADRVVTGVVPWVSLGLTNENALDAYANRFTYQVVLSAATLTPTTVSGMRGRITIHSAGPAVPGVPPVVPTGNQTNYCSGIPNPCAAVAVIVSHGKDGYGAYTRSGLRIAFDPSVTGQHARENVPDPTHPDAATIDPTFVIRDFSGNSTDPFDDIVMALTTIDLLTPLVIAGTLKDYRATLNAKFDRIKHAIVLDAVKSKQFFETRCSGTWGSCSPKHDSCPNNRPCGTPSFQYLIRAAGPGNTVPTVLGLDSESTKDAWGTVVNYIRPVSTVTPDTDPGVTVFTLSSNGPDGITGGAGNDDFEVPVTAADFIGLIARTGL